MVRNFEFAFDVFETSSDIWKNRREKVVASDALNLRRNFSPALTPQQRQRAGRIPPPARAEDRRTCQHRLLDHILHRLGAEIAKHVGQRKTVLRSQSDVDAIISSCRLEFEVE